MTELISMVPEAIAGYLISRFKIKSAMASQISLILIMSLHQPESRF
jgi:hypothetical protein